MSYPCAISMTITNAANAPTVMNTALRNGTETTAPYTMPMQMLSPIRKCIGRTLAYPVPHRNQGWVNP